MAVPHNVARDKLVISFSGGRTSAYMTYHLLNSSLIKDFSDVVVVFANTGQEHNDTLDFVNCCDLYFGWDVFWLEADIQKDKPGIGYKIVTYETAARWNDSSRPSPYEELSKKRGVPNVAVPRCSRDLKVEAITSFVVDHLGWRRRQYTTAIGIRADEPKRFLKEAKYTFPYGEKWHPLVQLGLIKEDVLDFWEEQPFDLSIPEHMGNCLWCFKKSDKKLMQVMSELPEAFDFPEKLERLYGKIHPKTTDVQYNIFRGNRTTQDMRKLFFSTADPTYLSQNPSLCEESCEGFE